MAHPTESTWAVRSAQVAETARMALESLASSKERYEELIEDYTSAGGTDQLYANQLFVGRPDPQNANPAELPATTAEVTKTQDLRLAMEAINDLWEAANNILVPQADRVTPLRRMS